VNLVTASLDQIAKIPGAEVQNINVQSCDNPTFSATGENVIAANAPRPQECDRQGPAQCATGTGGVKAVETPTAAPAPGAGGVAAPGTAGADGAPAGGAPTPGAGGATGSTGGGGGGSTGAAGTGGAGTGGAGGTTTGGATGTVTDPVTGAVVDPSAVDPNVVCDPDTGIGCDVSEVVAEGGGGGGAVASSAAAVGAIVPTTLDQDSGWGGKQILILLVILFTLALVFIPAVAWRKMAQVPAPAGAQSQSTPAQERVSA